MPPPWVFHAQQSVDETGITIICPADNAMTVCKRTFWHVAGVVATLGIAVGQAHAACNLIPAAERIFPSTLGSVASPVTAPGKTVEILLNAACDTASPGFDASNPANNLVTLTFE